MKEQVRCHKGRCETTPKTFLDECKGCNEVQKISHELLKKSVKNIR